MILYILVGAMVILAALGVVHLCYFVFARRDMEGRFIEQAKWYDDVLAKQDEKLSELTLDRDYWKKQAALEETVFLTKIDYAAPKKRKPTASKKSRKAS